MFWYFYTWVLGFSSCCCCCRCLASPFAAPIGMSVLLLMFAARCDTCASAGGGWGGWQLLSLVLVLEHLASILKLLLRCRRGWLLAPFPYIAVLLRWRVKHIYNNRRLSVVVAVVVVVVVAVVVVVVVVVCVLWLSLLLSLLPECLATPWGFPQLIQI